MRIDSPFYFGCCATRGAGGGACGDSKAARGACGGLSDDIGPRLRAFGGHTEGNGATTAPCYDVRDDFA